MGIDIRVVRNNPELFKKLIYLNELSELSDNTLKELTNSKKEELKDSFWILYSKLEAVKDKNHPLIGERWSSLWVGHVNINYKTDPHDFEFINDFSKNKLRREIETYKLFTFHGCIMKDRAEEIIKLFTWILNNDYVLING
jgi:hypothetical protein